jgi:predicted Zn-dependent protease
VDSYALPFLILFSQISLQSVNLALNIVIISMMKLVYTILLISIFVPRVLADELPELGDISQTILSPLQEKKIADQIMRDVMSSDEVVGDPEIQDYIQNLGMRLASNGPDKTQSFNFFVVRDNSINAFAMPGGVIGVHTGLIIAAKNESELAGVLGHEIGHVVQHHLARMLAQQKNDSIISMAGMALAVLSARANPQLATAAMTASSAGAVQKQLDYTRTHEREADRVGIDILEKSGFDTNAMAAFFETMQKGTRFVEGSAPSFLRTHPVTGERIADVRARVSQSRFRLLPYSPEFDYVRAKVMASLNTPSQAIAMFKDNLKEKRYSSETAQHYGMAIAMIRMNDLDGASEQLSWLRSNAPKHAFFAMLAANIEVARDNPEQAAKAYKAGLSTYPNHRGLIHGYAQHLIRIHQYEAAIKFVSEKLILFPNDPVLYELKSKSYAFLGKRLLSHQAQGEAYYYRYNLQRALEQMDLAVRANDGDFYQQSIAEARLNELRKQIDEPKKNGWFN